MEIILLAQNGHRHTLTSTEGSSIASCKQSLFDAWSPELGTPPTSPSQIRLIHAGKVLDDASPIAALGIPSAVVHISVRPASAEDLNKAKHGVLGKSGGCCIVS